MTWILSLIMLTGLGLGDLTRDQLQDRDRDPIQQKDQLHDGSCKTAIVIYFDQFNG